MTHTAIDPTKAALLDAILPHVAFDGWSPVALSLAAKEIGLDDPLTICPRGAVDLAIAFHQQGDAAMVAALAQTDMSDMRFRDKVAAAIRLRIAAVDDKEAVRRGTTLFAMPHMAADGTKLIWGTVDAIWTALGDTSQDANWYSKRMTLSAVYAAVVLYWLGDDSPDGEATDAFIDRRIEGVMQFEKVKARVKANPLFKPLTGPLDRIMAGIKAPTHPPRDDLPGVWKDPQ
ncbi:COQ9 family protein [Loktanella sp. D2R18]|uniref:COQ9 family protein n=1 Tax=Rhodobacterales TaxID=204455 RepID=UPI000DE8C054|nr:MULTISPECIES: COQ9 family protein [Rhodobacterales]MDO6591311.1 COQ9 family protein [Yoonia sp. 1_MG-2023]RBW46318.1 COQ9 family protein [Loktanella sp. D2R18]